MQETDLRIVEEIDRIRHEEQTPSRRALYVGRRVIVRVLRIVVGIAIFVVSCWLFGESWDLLSRPFASQSFLGLAGGLVVVYIAWMLLTLAWICAFGEGPDEDDHYQRRRLEAFGRIQAFGGRTTREVEDARARQTSEGRAWTNYVGLLLARLRSRL